MSDLQILSIVIGWSYFAAWSISFYPQIFLIIKRRSSHGLSLDFVVYNVLGFLCYFIYTITFFSNDEIRRQYAARNNGNMPLVQLNDVVFAAHAFLLTVVLLVLAFMFRESNGRLITRFAQYLLIAVFIVIFTLLITSIMCVTDWITMIYALSYIKIGTSLIKYLPQAYFNYVRKSTAGWSIINILLDFTGGSLSFIQLILDAYITDDWNGIFGNLIKVGLGVTSLVFDVLFIIQHYVLYRESAVFSYGVVKSEDEEDPIQEY
ncbi:hypothetical protein MP228_002670 [Amoeboaphelidium protococcarum]|nr:hypothetical protein MP228_002670 [Amoeboaphelidium protococcarum]